MSETKKMTKIQLQAELENKDVQLTAKEAELAALRQQLAVQSQKKRHQRGEPRPWVTYRILRLPPVGSMARQAVVCMYLLSKAKDPSDINEVEAHELIYAGANLLDTRQDPWWHVFCYYRPQLVKNDYLRIKEE